MVDWEAAQPSFEALVAKYPRSSWYLNNYALAACLAKDVVTAQRIFAQIEASCGRNLEIWNQERYERLKALGIGASG